MTRTTAYTINIKSIAKKRRRIHGSRNKYLILWAYQGRKDKSKEQKKQLLCRYLIQCHVLCESGPSLLLQLWVMS